MRKLLIALIATTALVAMALAAAIAFGTAAAPPYLESISAPFRSVDFSDLPPVENTQARDGTRLAFRAYRNTAAMNDGTVVIAIHVSSANSASLHPLARSLQRNNLTIYAPDVRGHGDSGKRGDIGNPHQLDDDLSDFVAMVRSAHPKARLILLGFSSGGGFALHAAATPVGAAFAHLVLISPMLGPRAPTAKKMGEGWARPYLPRIVALLALEQLGIHVFDHLPALAFAIAPGNPADLTGEYSFGLMRAFGTRDYVADLRKARAPIAVLVGEQDELFEARLFAPTIQSARPGVAVTVIPDLGHIQMTTDARALPAILAAIGASR